MGLARTQLWFLIIIVAEAVACTEQAADMRRALDALECYITWYSFTLPADIEQGLCMAQTLLPEDVEYIKRIHTQYRRPDVPRTLAGIQSLTYQGQTLMRQVIDRLTHAREAYLSLSSGSLRLRPDST